MKLSSSALVLGAVLIPLGVLLTALGVLSFANIFDNVLNCIRSPVPIPCGFDPQTELNLIVYPLLAIGLVLIVIGLVLLVYSSVTLRRHLQPINKENSE